MESYTTIQEAGKAPVEDVKYLSSPEGIRTVIVISGVTTREDVGQAPKQLEAVAGLVQKIEVLH